MKEYSQAQRFVADRRKFLDRWYGLSSEADRNGFLEQSKILTKGHMFRALVQTGLSVGLMAVALGSKNKTVRVLAAGASGLLSADLERVAKDIVEVQKISKVIQDHQI